MGAPDVKLTEVEDLRRKLREAQICLMWVVDNSSRPPLQIERAVEKTLSSIGRAG